MCSCAGALGAGGGEPLGGGDVGTCPGVLRSHGLLRVAGPEDRVDGAPAAGAAARASLGVGEAVAGTVGAWRSRAGFSRTGPGKHAPCGAVRPGVGGSRVPGLGVGEAFRVAFPRGRWACAAARRGDDEELPGGRRRGVELQSRRVQLLYREPQGCGRGLPVPPGGSRRPGIRGRGRAGAREPDGGPGPSTFRGVRILVPRGRELFP